MEEIKYLQEIADELSALPDPTYWFDELREIRQKLGKNKGNTIAILAKRRWLKKICSSSYPLHPDVKRNIEYKCYILNDNDNLLILATLIALIDGDNAEDRYHKCKIKITKKYGKETWRKIINTSTIINRVLSNQNKNIPYSWNIMATRSITAQGWLQDDYLSKLPTHI